MEKQNEMELDLGVLMLYLLQKSKIIAVVTLLVAAAAFGISSFALPVQYTASTRVYVLNRNGGSDLSYSDYQVADQMIEDYSILITGTNVTREVISRLELNMTEEKLEKMIRVEVLKNTRILQISVKDTDPVRAAEIANCVRTVASEQIKTIMAAEAVNLIYEAETPREPSGPDVLKITLFSALGGLLTASMYFGILCVLDDGIRTEEDVASQLNLCVLSVIPNSQLLEKRDNPRRDTEIRKYAGKK